jgi:hypothetical protein
MEAVQTSRTFLTLGASAWEEIGLITLAVIAVLALVFGRRLVAQFLREPIGLGVPLVAVVTVLLAPQMPDMLIDGTIGGAGVADVSPWRWLGMAISPTLLGVLGWYWTRAAVNAPFAVSDHLHPKDEPRVTRDDLSPHVTALPRLALWFAIIIASAPAGVTWYSTRIIPHDGLILATIVSVSLNFIIWWYVSKKREDGWFVARHSPPTWMWCFQTTSLLAAAPMGWRVAIALLVLAFGACAIVGFAPELVDPIHAPAIALGAMAASIGPLCLTLALLRDVCWVILATPQFALGHSGREMQPPARWLGLILFAVLTYIPVKFWQPEQRYAIRGLEGSESIVTDRLSAAGVTCDLTGNGRVNLRCAFEEWYDARKHLTSGGQPLPLVIVAAEGGASRAATWLLSAMRLLDYRTDGRFGAHVFGISAVSGGALGAASYLLALRMHIEDRTTGDPARIDPNHYKALWEMQGVRRMLWHMAGADLLAPSIATFFLNDTIAPVWGPLWPFGGDRGLALERSFERHWSDPTGLRAPNSLVAHGFLQIRNPTRAGDRARLPHLFLNGTERNSGRRSITSSIRFDPQDDWMAAEDLLSVMAMPRERVNTNITRADAQSLSQARTQTDRMRNQSATAPILREVRDVPLSTAVLNAARFPFISPAGQYWAGPAAQQLLDGGYFENYGARTALEIATAIERLRDPTRPVLPIVVIISNDADGWMDLATAQEAGETISETSDDRLLVNRTIHCDWLPTPLTPSALARRGAGGSGLPQLVAPIAGLYATRGAHGQATLLALRREMCEPRTIGGTRPEEPDDRLFHIALPRARPIIGSRRPESSPMNWVLNPAARNLLLETGPNIRFNCDQADYLDRRLNPQWRNAAPKRCALPSLSQ